MPIFSLPPQIIAQWRPELYQSGGHSHGYPVEAIREQIIIIIWQQPLSEIGQESCLNQPFSFPATSADAMGLHYEHSDWTVEKLSSRATKHAQIIE